MREYLTDTYVWLYDGSGNKSCHYSVSGTEDTINAIEYGLTGEVVDKQSYAVLLDGVMSVSAPDTITKLYQVTYKTVVEGELSAIEVRAFDSRTTTVVLPEGNVEMGFGTLDPGDGSPIEITSGISCPGAIIESF